MFRFRRRLRRQSLVSRLSSLVPRLWSLVIVFGVLVLGGVAAWGEREIFVPFEDLSTVLQDETQFVMLSVEEYHDLLERARKEAEGGPSVAGLLSSAAYAVTIGEERARGTTVGH